MPKVSPTERAVQEGRVTKLCPICGRGIFADHNLSGLNYDKHIEACPKLQMKKRRAEGKRYINRIAKSAKALDQAVPKLGQLGFPFEGVPKEVGG